MKRVVIDINSVLPLYSRGWTSGIGRTTKELVDSLNRVAGLPFEVMLYSQNIRGISARMMDTHFKTRHFYLPHKPWVNRIIGTTHLRELSTGYDLLHIPHNFEWVRKPEKTIVTIHDAMYFACPEEVFNYRYYQRVYPTLARRCKAIITCSESSKNDIMRYMDVAEEKIHVSPWGYNDKIFRPKEETDFGNPYFLSVSCSLGRKNTISAIRAYEKLLTNKPSHKLKLVWTNVPKEVTDYCRDNHLNGHVEFIANVGDEQLALLYSNATATFFPSRYEGFGLPVLESMACGTPVVTCRNSALPEVGGDVALYVEPDDIDAMSRIMEQFEQGELQKSHFTGRCTLQASRFSWQQCALQTIDVYKKCLK